MAYKNFISLGYYCGTAASMSKLGIRSFSGPFDWCVSEFDGVLSCLNNEFFDFMHKNNLEVEEKFGIFNDVKYGFKFTHEIKAASDFESKYEDIYNKYLHRIEVFKQEIKQETCFIRILQNMEELIYIKEHFSYIESIIKRHNTKNDIIYLLNTQIFDIENLSHPFYLYTHPSYGGRKGLRDLFSSNAQMQAFFINNFDENKRYRNMVFDLQQENKRLELNSYRYELLLKIDKIDIHEINLPEKIIVYGAGNIGKRFFQKIRNKCMVLLFLEQNPNDKFYEGIPIIHYDEYRSEQYSQIPIVVTPCYEYQEIKAALTKRYENINVIPLTDFLTSG